MDKRKDPTYVGAYLGSGLYTLVYTEQAGDDILFEGLKNVFVRSGHKWTDPADADILVDIILHELVAMDKGIEISKYQTGSLDVQISFVDRASEQVFYTNRYSGSSATPYNIAERLQLVIISCMDNVGSDVKLARAIINRFKTTSQPN